MADVAFERIHEAGDQYEFEGKWLPLGQRQEEIHVKGRGDPLVVVSPSFLCALSPFPFPKISTPPLVFSASSKEKMKEKKKRKMSKNEERRRKAIP